MLARLLLLPFFLVAGAFAVPAAAAVAVAFTNPDRYTDVGKHYAQAEVAQREIEGFLKQLGKHYLAPGQTLVVEVLDIDLAGRYEPRGPNLRELRIVRDQADFPLLKLRYVLKAEDRILAAGEDIVTDRVYRFHSSAPSSNEPMSYEKRMLREWFIARFTERRNAGPVAR